MAEAICNNNDRDLWSELKRLSKGPVQADCIDGCLGNQPIAELFATKYETIYNSVGYSSDSLDDIVADLETSIANTQDEHYVVMADEVDKAISKLNLNKKDGNLGLFSNHFKYAPKKLSVHLSLLFTSMLAHGYTPEELQITTLISIPKDMKQSLSESTNYRGIALCSLICKIYDLIILNRHSDLLCSSAYQFAYKNDHSTTLCTNLLKETAEHYMEGGGVMYSCLLDASKAFDRVDFIKLFQLLVKRRLPPIIIRSLINLYTTQTMRAEWNGYRTDLFNVTNGTRQGAILSCSLFCLYIDELLLRLQNSGYGCRIGHRFFGSFGYADDVTINSPTVYGLQKMLNVCEEYGQEFSVSFNEKKTLCIKFCQSGVIPDALVTLNGKKLKWVPKAKHLGNWINNTLECSIDCNEKKGHFISSVNKLMNKFGSSPYVVKRKLFLSYCMSFYGSQAWQLDSDPVQEVITSWNKAVRRTFNVPYQTHTTLLPGILQDKSLSHSLDLRFAKYAHAGLNSKNSLVQFTFQRSLACLKGSIGNNIKYLMYKYNVSKCSFNDKSLHHAIILDVDNVIDKNFQKTSMVVELLIQSIPGFTSEEVKDIILDVCTN